jgi:SAM-dependent methyltransferase
MDYKNPAGQMARKHAYNTCFVVAAQVLSVYLFHEMPEHAQQAAAKEMSRVLKPGGLLVLCDSIQRGDR